MLAPKALSASQVPVTEPMLVSWFFSALLSPPHPKHLQLMGFSLQLVILIYPAISAKIFLGGKGRSSHYFPSWSR